MSDHPRGASPQKLLSERTCHGDFPTKITAAPDDPQAQLPPTPVQIKQVRQLLPVRHVHPKRARRPWPNGLQAVKPPVKPCPLPSAKQLPVKRPTTRLPQPPAVVDEANPYMNNPALLEDARNRLVSGIGVGAMTEQQAQQRTGYQGPDRVVPGLCHPVACRGDQRPRQPDRGVGVDLHRCAGGPGNTSTRCMALKAGKTNIAPPKAALAVDCLFAAARIGSPERMGPTSLLLSRTKGRCLRSLQVSSRQVGASGGIYTTSRKCGCPARRRASPVVLQQLPQLPLWAGRADERRRTPALSGQVRVLVVTSWRPRRPHP